MKKLFIAFVCLVHTAAYCQQDPVYATYVVNPVVVNPAFAGNYDLLHAQLSYRTQWVGLEGSARTVNFTGHTSISNKTAFGIQVLQDAIGENKNSEFQAAFSYKLHFNTSVLSFGMQAGVINFASNPDELTIRHGGDPYFNHYSQFTFNTGAGLLLSSHKYAFGISAPRLLPSTISQSGEQIEVYRQTLYVTGTYTLPLSEKVEFKPAVLLRGTKDVPVSTDVHANFSFNDSYIVGVFTRNLNAYGVSGRFKYKRFQLGYVFEMPTDRSVGSQFSSHEVMLAVRTSVFRFHQSIRDEDMRD